MDGITLEKTFISGESRLSDIRFFTEKIVEKLSEISANPNAIKNRMDEIILAVNETAANVFIHAYGGSAGKELTIRAEGAPQKLIFHFFDKGDAFHMDNVTLPLFNGQKESGFGLYIIKELADNFIYEKTNEGYNHTVMFFSFIP